MEIFHHSVIKAAGRTHIAVQIIRVELLEVDIEWLYYPIIQINQDLPRMVLKRNQWKVHLFLENKFLILENEFLILKYICNIRKQGH